MAVELWISLGAGIIAIAAVAISLYVSFKKTGQAPTTEDVASKLKGIPDLADQLQKVGLMAVASADQIIKGEGLDVNDAKFKEAFSYVDNWSKNILGVDLDAEMVKKIVEGSYKMYKETLVVDKAVTVQHVHPLTELERSSE